MTITKRTEICCKCVCRLSCVMVLCLFIERDIIQEDIVIPIGIPENGKTQFHVHLTAFLMNYVAYINTI
jgi:hypothetical protein